jgi:hypothetical protein
MNDARPDPSLTKLTNIMGPARAKVLVAETLRQAGLTAIETPDDRYRFACALMLNGGICEAIGRAIKIQAILHGARER